MRLAALIGLSLVLADAMPSAARVVRVKPGGDGDVPSIQQAVVAASAGDTILLANGTYAGEGQPRHPRRPAGADDPFHLRKPRFLHHRLRGDGQRIPLRGEPAREWGPRGYPPAGGRDHHEWAGGDRRGDRVRAALLPDHHQLRPPWESSGRARRRRPLRTNGSTNLRPLHHRRQRGREIWRRVCALLLRRRGGRELHDRRQRRA